MDMIILLIEFLFIPLVFVTVIDLICSVVERRKRDE